MMPLLFDGLSPCLTFFEIPDGIVYADHSLWFAAKINFAGREIAKCVISYTAS